MAALCLILSGAAACAADPMYSQHKHEGDLECSEKLYHSLSKQYLLLSHASLLLSIHSPAQPVLRLNS